MNKKVFTSQEEVCERSKEASLNHKAAQQVKKQGLDLQKTAIFEEILGKKGLAFWYKGHQSIINLCPTLPGSAGALLTWAGGCQAPKTHKNVQKPKILIKF